MCGRSIKDACLTIGRDYFLFESFLLRVITQSRYQTHGDDQGAETMIREARSSAIGGSTTWRSNETGHYPTSIVNREIES